MFRENDVVRLVHDIPAGAGTRWPGTAQEPVIGGTIGTVVMASGDEDVEARYEVEFVGDDGSTLALLTLMESDIESAD